MSSDVAALGSYFGEAVEFEIVDHACALLVGCGANLDYGVARKVDRLGMQPLAPAPLKLSSCDIIA